MLPAAPRPLKVWILLLSVDHSASKRQWLGRAHTVLVREDGFEYEGRHYRSLSVIAERIIGAHWSVPRFFGMTTRTGPSVSAEVAP
jgi:hypothetical protein